MDPEENKYGPQLEFKEVFLESALNYGEAGDTIITGQDIVIIRILETTTT
jgi:hypothetical protein